MADGLGTPQPASPAAAAPPPQPPSNSFPMTFDSGAMINVPPERVNDAFKAGGKLAQPMKFPDGSVQLIPFDQVHDKMAQGAIFMPSGTPGTVPKPTVRPNIYDKQGRVATRGMQMTTEPTLGDYLATAINLGTDTAPGAESATPAVGTEDVEGYRQATAPGATRDQRMGGVARMVRGTGEALSPMMGPELFGGLGTVAKLGAGMGTAMYGSKALPKAVAHYGGGPGAQELAGELGQWIPSAIGMLAGAASPEDYATTRGDTVDALSKDILAKGGVTEPLARETAQGMMRRYEQTQDPRWLDARNAAAPAEELPNVSFGKALATKALQGAAALQGGARGALGAGLGQEQQREPVAPNFANLGQPSPPASIGPALEAGGQGGPTQISPIQAAEMMKTRLDEGGPNQAAAIHIDDAAKALVAGASRVSGQPMGGTWKGINLQREHGQNISFVLSDLADRIEQSGAPDTDQAVANLRKLSYQLDRVDTLNSDPNAGHAGVPLIHDPTTFQHEAETHAGQRAFAGGSGDIRNFTDFTKTLSDPNDPTGAAVHPAAEKAAQVLKQWGYNVNEPAVVTAEMQAHILDRNWEKLGLTKEEATDWMRHSLNVLEQYHGPDKMGENIPRLAQGYVSAIQSLIGEKGETGATANEPATATEPAAAAAQPEGTAAAYGDNAPAGENAPRAAGGGIGAPALRTAQEVGPSLEAIDPAKNLSAKLKREAKDPNAGAPKQPEATKLEDPETGKPVYVGRKTTDQWIDQVRNYIAPDEMPEWRAWYRTALQHFIDKEGGDVDRGTKRFMGFMATQRGTSPVAGYQNLTRAEDIQAGFPEIKKPGMGAEPIYAFLRGEQPTSGIGAKISDFIDSGLGKTTRTWMGDDPRGGAPVAGDRHAARDSGFVDGIFHDYIRRTFGDQVADQFQQDMRRPKPGVDPPGPNEAQYENISNYYNNLAKELNARNFDGGQWTPAEAQAVGWGAQIRMLGGTPQTIKDIFPANQRLVSSELSFGEGSPYSKKYPSLNGLPYEKAHAITQQVMDKIIDIANREAGGKVIQRYSGPGGYKDYPVTPSMQAIIEGSPEAAQRLSDVIGYLAQQTEVMTSRPLDSGKQSGFQIVEKGSNTLHSPERAQAFWDDFRNTLQQRDPELAAKIQGFMPVVVDGQPGLRMMTREGAYTDKDIPILHDVANEVSNRAGVDGGSIDVGTKAYPAVVEVSGHDWTGDPTGSSYLGRLGQTGRPDIQGRLARAHSEIDAEIQRAFETHAPEALGPSQKGVAPNPPQSSPPVAPDLLPGAKARPAPAGKTKARAPSPIPAPLKRAIRK